MVGTGRQHSGGASTEDQNGKFAAYLLYCRKLLLDDQTVYMLDRFSEYPALFWQTGSVRSRPVKLKVGY
jgi:hypothetical protein